MKVAFIGLGRMGQAMARRLLDAGHDLVLYNRTPEKLAELASAGAATAPSPAEAARGAEVAITMLGSDYALEEISRALSESLPSGAVHVAMGTHSVQMIQKVAEIHAKAGQTLVCSPVLGRPEAVTAGRLGIIAAGPAEAVERCRPLFDAMGRRTFEAGELPAAGAAMKIANNFLLGCAIEAIGEAFSLVHKCGVPRPMFYEILADGLFTSPVYTGYGKTIANEDWDHVGFTATLGLKDVNLALSAGEAVGVPLPSGNVWRDRLVGAIAHGDGEKDWAVMALEQARASGLA